MADTVLATQGLTRNFGEFCAVDQVSIEIQRGSITGLIGPNGAGKSTLFQYHDRHIATLVRKGFAEWQRCLWGRTGQALCSGLGADFSTPRPFARMSVLENVMLAPLAQVGERLWGPFFCGRAVKRREQAIHARAMEVLEFMTLSALADHPAGKISGGQMKLLEMARVLMGDPQVILLDEPAAGVNPTLTGTLIEKIEALNQQGKTFVIIEHDMDFIMRHCDPVIALAEGRVVFEGTAAQAQTSTVLLDAYLGARADA